MTVKTSRTPDYARKVQQTIEDGGPGAWRQAFDLALLAIRRTGFDANEYYNYGLWDRSVRAKAIKSYLPQSQCRAFIQSLSGPAYCALERQFIDKMAFDQNMRENGIPCPETVAVYSPDLPIDGAERIANKEGLESFLVSGKGQPLFGKTRFGSHALGAVSIDGVTDDQKGVRFGNGKTVPIESLINEIDRDWRNGYLFQKRLFNHETLRPHLGGAIGTVRLVTVLGDHGPEVFNMFLRLPSATAMHDNASFGARAHAVIDRETGQVTRLHVLDRASAKVQKHWAAPDQDLVGLALPHFNAMIGICTKAHALFPGLALIGFDIALTDAGPVMIEANLNPYLSSFQANFGTGLKSADWAPKFDRAKEMARKAVN